MAVDTTKIHNVKPVTFEGFAPSEDGERVVFSVYDKQGNVGHIAIDWLKLGLTVQLIERAAEAAKDVRQKLGKSDGFEEITAAEVQLVSAFQVSEVPDRNLKILTLQSPTGFRCDFAIPTDTADQRGRLMPRAIAEELQSDMAEERKRPN